MDDDDEEELITGDPPEALIGTKIGGQYTVVGILGEGGLGTIYTGYQEMVDRYVAIKFLPAALAKDQIIVKRLAREAKALGRLNHPNIVTTYDFGFTEKREPYLVLELVAGETLQARIEKSGPLSAAEALPLFIQLADAMRYAHMSGIVHRDLKPANIMLVKTHGQTSVKILDFGIAQMESEAQKLTLAGEIWGSPHYMSPEQCSGDAVDHLTDIYSIGLVMYFTLSAKLPHTGGSFAEVVSQKLFEPIPSFAALGTETPLHVPVALEKIVFNCLKRKSHERYQSMEDLKNALEAFAKQTDADIKNAVNRKPAVMPDSEPPKGRRANTEAASDSRGGSRNRPQAATANANPATKLILPVVAGVVILVAAMATFYFVVLQSRNTKTPGPGAPQASSPQAASPQAASPQTMPQNNLPVEQEAVQPSINESEKSPAPPVNENIIASPRHQRHNAGGISSSNRAAAHPRASAGAAPSEKAVEEVAPPRQTDENGFYTKWGGVKDSH